MNGRLCSVLALVGALASLVLVATLTSDSQARPAVSSPKAPPAAWTRFHVRPVMVLVGGGLVEAEAVTTQPAAMPPRAPRLIYRLVRSQSVSDSRLALARRGD